MSEPTYEYVKGQGWVATQAKCYPKVGDLVRLTKPNMHAGTIAVCSGYSNGRFIVDMYSIKGPGKGNLGPGWGNLPESHWEVVDD